MALVVVLLSIGGKADASPRPAVGFRATVLGWSSWYGSYDMGSLGAGFCVDHGIRAPDPSLVYVPATLSQPREVVTSLAWLYGVNGGAARTDRVTAAAVMLAGHDLVGARYPQGRLDVGSMTPSNLAGFSGHEAAVLATARRVRADAVAHANLSGPLQLTLAPGGEREAVATLRDAGGRGVGGVAITGTDLTPPSTVTGPDGTARFQRTGGSAAVQAVVPDLQLRIFRASHGAAQRVAIPGSSRLAAAMPEPPPPPLPDGRLRITKHGVPGLPVAGARFELQRQGSTGESVVMTIGEDGRAGPVKLRPGTWTVTEVRAPPGYEVAGPWTVAVLPARERHLEVTDRPIPTTTTSSSSSTTSTKPPPSRTTISTTSTTEGTTPTTVAGPPPPAPPASEPPLEDKPREALPTTGREIARIALFGGASALVGLALTGIGGSHKRRRIPP